VKTYVTHLPFTIQPQIPQYNESQRLRKGHDAATRVSVSRNLQDPFDGLSI